VHRGKFDELAGKAGVTGKDKLDALYKLSEYAADSDDVDDKKITAAVEKTKGTYASLFAAPAAAETKPSGDGKTVAGATVPTSTKPGPGPGADRGEAVSTSTSTPGRIPGRL
jgi:hypothetical protein